jgi:hypothetical protein
MNLEVLHRRLSKSVRILLALVIAQSISLSFGPDESNASPKDDPGHVTQAND